METSRLVLGQEAVADKTNEITAIPLLLERLAATDGLKGALVSIDAIATNPTAPSP
jgi:predicted transposase YbfD/YdcC